MNLLIKGGRVIDPSQGIDEVLDILVENGAIKELGKGLAAPAGAGVVDAAGLIVTPGLIDMHVHLRDPGLEYKEDIVTGTRAAAAGGFTSVACMPNTKPVNDNKAVTSYIVAKAKAEGLVNVFPVGSITQGSKGDALAEMGDLKEAGCVAVSDDGRPVTSSELMRRALEYAKGMGIMVISHAEDLSLVGEGVMNEGFVSTELGLKGIPWAAEDAATARDVYLAEFTNSPLHIAHVSTMGSLRIIRNAKARGVKVTCETAPHYFSLTDDAVRGYNTNAKMNPPLRTADDLAAVKEALKDGTIDAIATDHAPHHLDEKDVEFNVALNGIIGLETSLPLSLKLVEEGVLTLPALVEKMACNPAAILGIDRGTLRQGAVADITVIDPAAVWTVEAGALASKSKNSPFLGWEMKGAAAYTIVGGTVVHSRG
ncbi:dihydroorotase [Geobacter sulfurreducens]|jgi:dihydroorotase|uniref:Dihydroorotase n=1 Tax=Geobacter sulfurreducens (strain ATCC 51573 / DSM 12127 / PCA) TaxID=243231 RepID=PYRC_GEOSL|nr:dihydroorotase [Geobacter sulfurreducens]Q74DP4.1 RecName: Full=Dihydroorotase; Short=DHOase [Geobacter sulfurreducens PCA]AAR34648.1 dihydroorotase [Geobacter sulfurreducens PCA]AJY70982.1 dihydroorotase [Geobacter sulfurreducens]QVW36487.1 dihydroorotase [Geobacter sulfurreducens]UAC05301.1 dihydroorotase [Geobacter sulfurreducens]HBB69106.1 dihydroorotase [Geobacter sulfurreducens]